MNVVSAEENPLGEGGERLHEWAISLVEGLVLGGGERRFDHLGDAEIGLEQVRAVAAPGVVHVKYAVS